jgi:hypothetical protein
MASGGSTTGTSGPTLTPAPVTGSKVTSSNTTVQNAPSVLPVNNPEVVPHYQFQVPPHLMPAKKINGRGSVIQHIYININLYENKSGHNEDI